MIPKNKKAKIANTRGTTIMDTKVTINLVLNFISTPFCMLYAVPFFPAIIISQFLLIYIKIDFIFSKKNVKNILK